MSGRPTPEDVLKSCQLAEPSLYVVGAYDTGVTVRSQQIRALNLVWGLIESRRMPSNALIKFQDAPRTSKIAIIGGGFAGLSLAAGLIEKGSSASITIFEQCDTLLPLQQGSDTRWLHPHIYDWPSEGSEAHSAMVPVLNWTAARASDVVVQVLADWGRRLPRTEDAVSLFCNTRHLQVSKGNTGNWRVEWVGERRHPSDGAVIQSSSATVGSSADFDVVILTLGFGIEQGETLSYWRNETFGQPSLARPRTTYLVSGQGDGAMIDLLRLRISQYRQDRILHELFADAETLVAAIRDLQGRCSEQGTMAGFYGGLEDLAREAAYSAPFQSVFEKLKRRLRRDTEVILRLKVRQIYELLDSDSVKISFQNRLLVYLLYKCGGFTPSDREKQALTSNYAISSDHIIERHGVNRSTLIENVIAKGVSKTDNCEAKLRQTDHLCFPGGYFGSPGTSEDQIKVSDPVRRSWRKEYLPGPTALVATAFCSAVVGILRPLHGQDGRLRVTLHRSLVVGVDELLQQSCPYVGIGENLDGAQSAGRTFPARNATIGIAYSTRRIVRSVKAVEPNILNEAMGTLKLIDASRAMSTEVGFVLAVPLLEPEAPNKFTSPGPVSGVLYVDSTATGFFVEDNEIAQIVSMANELLQSLEVPSPYFDRIRNVPLNRLGNDVPPREELPEAVKHALELVDIEAPRSRGAFEFNFDHADFLPV